MSQLKGSGPEQLATTRVELGVSRTELAALLGLDPAQFLELERSNDPLPPFVIGRLQDLRERASSIRIVEGEALHPTSFTRVEHPTALDYALLLVALLAALGFTTAGIIGAISGSFNRFFTGVLLFFGLGALRTVWSLGRRRCGQCHARVSGASRTCTHCGARFLSG
jgi:hypothetical protein